MRYDGYCVLCDAYIRITWALAGYNLKMCAENIVCTRPNCNQQSFYVSGMCYQHLSSLLFGASQEKTPMPLVKTQEAFQLAARKRWVYPLKYDRVLRRMDEMLQNKRPGLDLVVLDDKYSPSSRQLWEFAMVEQISGVTVINTIVEHPNGIDHSRSTGDGRGYLHILSKSKASSVYSASQSSSIDCINVHQTAATLRHKGITPDTIFLVW